MATPNSQVDAATRKEIFHEQYGNGIDAGITLAELVAAAGDYLSQIIGVEDVDAGMARMVRPLVVCAGGDAFEQDSMWREALEQARSNCFSEWPLGQQFHDLAAYAEYGIVLSEFDDPADASRLIASATAAAELFIARSPLALWKVNTGAPDKSDLARLVRLASNRWALDNGNAVEPLALAEFGGVTEGRVRNLMSEQAFDVEAGKITAYSAAKWLEGRPDFWNSVWREQRVSGEKSPRELTPFGEVYFVPVARDGSVFNPGLNRGGSFTIGEKGDERHLARFEEALEELQKMGAPRWRRPNNQGNWGIVRGVRWERFDAASLEEFARNPAQILTKSVE